MSLYLGNVYSSISLKTRRSFLKSSFFTTALIIMPKSELFGAVSTLETISLVQEDLSPSIKKLGINGSSYLSLILHHSRVTDDEKEFLKNGVQWLNEEAVFHYKHPYIKLSPSQRQNVLQIISKQRWGDNWIYTMLSYIMEATLSDPIYGANKNGAGWKWLEHIPGLPQPKEPYL
ncbi:hypothetical protein M947_01455 [Sulfurimonas hongkongensis]|uniref:Gluconate 2-dehydrogenase subunit 3 family protein n=1 Tax=Sulfurimonas hongkongensis TaxID=1172190 RepID=T0JTX3_9BACT|nr:gluconate 2-dehydrogenase subunit 3 family protein [Sulfurimonas hongkongensis]EQB40492.1 hypothetical protein M947_01455 [Sulfurimonas hongkongensis]